MARIQLALCLSGGGFRASLFHLGVLKRLHEVQLLRHVQIISGVSGGAITAALFNANVKGRDKDGGGFAYDWESFEAKLLKATSRGVIHHFYAAALMWIFGLSTSLAGLFGHTGLSIALLVLTVTEYVYLLRAAMRANALVVETDARFKTTGQEEKVRWLRYPVAAMPFSPSEMRVVTLVLELFGGTQLRQIFSFPRLCLSAVDLVSGKQKVFSADVLAELSAPGATAVWESKLHDGAPEIEEFSLADNERSFKSHYDIRSLPVARAVAASTAFPPIFNAVPVCHQDAYMGSFVDGGVLDNLGINPMIQFALSISSERGRYKDGRYSTFSATVSHILIADAGRRSKRHTFRYLFRPFAIRRIISVMLESQATDAEKKVALLHAVTGLRVRWLGLVLGLPGDDALSDDQWAQILPHIRTQLDAFSSSERGLLTYSGYKWADYWLKLEFEDLSNDFPLSRSISDFLAEEQLNHSERQLMRALKPVPFLDPLIRFIKAFVPSLNR
jgi:predicted acylesterase/phospholipase RssA